MEGNRKADTVEDTEKGEDNGSLFTDHQAIYK